MPWGAVSRGAIGVGILKPCLEQHGYPVDVHYFNVRFAKQIGAELYARISASSATLIRSIAEEEVPRFIENCIRSVDWSRYGTVGFSTSFAQRPPEII